MSQRILIIDDDVELCQLLAEFLGLEGFTVSAVHDGAEAVSHCKGHAYDAIVLDVMLPRLQGFEVLRKIRQYSDTPVLMLTARGDDTDRIVGLEMGADDYLPKPCNPRELAARLRAILRRTERSSAAPTTLEVGATTLHSSDRSASFDGRELPLTTAEFNVLWVLLRHAGQVVEKEVLSQQALNRQLTAYDRSIDVHVSNLRKKLTSVGAATLIKNIRGVGYQYIVANG